MLDHLVTEVQLVMLTLDILLVVIVTTVDRIDYSNDTATSVTKGPLLLVDMILEQQVNFIWILWWWWSWYINSTSY